MLKVKTNTKILLILGIMLVAMFVVNMNTVNAVTDENINVILQNEIQENIFSISANVNKYDKSTNISLEYNPFKIYELSQNITKMDALMQSNGFVYQSIYIELENGIDEVTITEDNTNLDIVEINGVKYAQYNVAVLKKENNRFIPYNGYKNITIQYKEHSNIKLEQKTTIRNGQNGHEGYIAYIDIVDKNDNYLGKFNYNDTDSFDNGTCMAGERGWSSTEISTSYDYSNAYYRLTLDVNVGNSITIDGLGTFEYIGNGIIENWEEGGIPSYIYKMKIVDTSILSKAQSKKFTFEVVNVNTKQGAYNIIDFYVSGNTRQTYAVNDETKNIGITLNGATGIGVSLKADIINENDNTYIEMTNTIGNNGRYIWINAYDISLTGKYEGELLITFVLGTENNGKTVCIWHKKHAGNYENFEEIVKNGKVTIKVTELSPFLLAYKNVEITNQENTTTEQNSNEKDDTPKTGTETNTIPYVLGIIATIGIAFIIKRK